MSHRSGKDRARFRDKFEVEDKGVQLDLDGDSEGLIDVETVLDETEVSLMGEAVLDPW